MRELKDKILDYIIHAEGKIHDIINYIERLIEHIEFYTKNSQDEKLRETLMIIVKDLAYLRYKIRQVDEYLDAALSKLSEVK